MNEAFRASSFGCQTHVRTAIDRFTLCSSEGMALNDGESSAKPEELLILRLTSRSLNCGQFYFFAPSW